MKKIILIMILLIALASAVFAEEINREKYMPKKLIYSELPDDYPKELDELFEFYYEFYIHTAGKDSTYLENTFLEYIETIYHDRSKSFFDSLSSNKKRKIFYLNWLANNTIADYYTEYMRINGSTSPWYDEDARKSASYINPAIITYMKKEFPNNWNTITLGGSATVLISIKRFVLENEKNENWFVNRFPKLIVRGKIKEISKYETIGNIEIPLFYTIKVSLIDAIGNIFDDKEIKLILLISKYNNQSYCENTVKKHLKKGNEYIFSINGIDAFYENFPVIEYKSEKYGIHHDYTIRLGSIIPLADEKLGMPLQQLYGIWLEDYTYEKYKRKFENDLNNFFLELKGE